MIVSNMFKKSMIANNIFKKYMIFNNNLTNDYQ